MEEAGDGTLTILPQNSTMRIEEHRIWPARSHTFPLTGQAAMQSLPDRESGSILMFDASHSLVHMASFEGDGCSILFPWRTLMGTALTHDCRKMILYHDHPSGDPRPSTADIATTRRLCHMLIPLNIRLCDHLIQAGNSWFSFRAHGLL
jgi:DNA repair protein RadC